MTHLSKIDANLLQLRKAKDYSNVVNLRLDGSDQNISKEQIQSNSMAVSYTHLDVYKRQEGRCSKRC